LLSDILARGLTSGVSKARAGLTPLDARSLAGEIVEVVEFENRADGSLDIDVADLLGY
jgi:hypothetical protein